MYVCVCISLSLSLSLSIYKHKCLVHCEVMAIEAGPYPCWEFLDCDGEAPQQDVSIASSSLQCAVRNDEGQTNILHKAKAKTSAVTAAGGVS